MSNYYKEPPPGRMILLRGVPEDLHAALRMWAARDNISLQKLIIGILSEAVEKEGFSEFPKKKAPDAG